MDGSRLIAWAIGLVAVAVGIAVIARETAFAEHVKRLALDLPTIPAHLGALVKETQLIGREVLAFVIMLVLFWTKLR